jgi:1-acyl-sn-glycerol-3-phosphate acyltransferase
MLRILGIPLEVSGAPPVQGPMLLVANHISWLDILVLHAARHCRFVAKSDVKHWPLLGTLATGGGTLYIEREKRRDAMRVVHHMAESLQRGEIVAVFPEGTTGDGEALLPFHANLVQAAVSAHAPAQPVGLRFVDRRTGRNSSGPLYLGEDTLLSSLWRTLATGGGTLYIEREKRRDAMRVVHHMAESLKKGEILAVFPEGTTGDGEALLPFHANLVQAAISAHAPAQPVGLRFVDRATGKDSGGPLYVGEDTLLSSLWRTLAGPPFVAQVRFGVPQGDEGRDRRQWAHDLHAVVDALRKDVTPAADESVTPAANESVTPAVNESVTPAQAGAQGTRAARETAASPGFPPPRE